MRNLIRSPLTWMVAAEVLVVTLLAIVAWTMVANAARTVVVSPSIEMPESASDAAAGLPDFPVSLPPAARGPLPGLNLDSSFWRARLVQMNREQSFLARLEWRLVHGATDALKRYVETVVLPAVQRAERGGREISAKPALSWG